MLTLVRPCLNITAMAYLTLAQARTLIKWTQSKLAREAKCHVMTIRAVESGETKSPNYHLVMQVVNALRRGGLPGLMPEDIFSADVQQEEVA
jgi:transcriptional regulator with XRE-family HTH domain